MKIVRTDRGALVDRYSLMGILAGFGMLVPAFLGPDIHVLALPACAVLLPSMLYGLR
ncbi:MAG: hypothetical protein AAF430_13290 [Myxococcota bacterium]